MQTQENELARTWAAEWKRLSLASRWQRGKRLYDQNGLMELQTREGSIKGIVHEEKARFELQITCELLNESEINHIKESFQSCFKWTLLPYRTEIDYTDVPETIQTLFRIPKLSFHCTCEQYDTSPCKHLVVTALAMGNQINRDPAELLLFRGIDWGQLLSGIDVKQPSVQQSNNTTYRLIPLSRHPDSQSLHDLKKPTPPFWVSPFPFPLIMEEIYEKAQEGKEALEGKKDGK